MKGALKGITAIVCAALTAMSFAACQQDALTPYETAVKNGFVGTEAEWLASLRGADGKDGADMDVEALYQAAKDNGYEGEFLDFLKEFNIQVNEDNDVATIAKNAMSVVSIYCGFSQTTQTGGFWNGTKSETTYYAAAGAGVIIDLNKQAGNAWIVTNYHVIYDANSDSDGISDCIYLYTYGALNKFDAEKGDVNGDGMKATYVGGAMDYDIALLKVEGKVDELATAEEAKLADSDEVSVGEKVFAIGNPDGAGIAVTSGVVSVESEYIEMTSTDGAKRSVDYRVMRTDAAINHGNSGGALFNAAGELIGITNAKNVNNEVDNMGYALPITPVKYLCKNIVDNNGVVKRAMLGIKVTTVASSASIGSDGKIKIVEEFAVADAVGVGEAAYRKLSAGDVLLGMQINDGAQITFKRQYQLSDMLLTVRKGDRVTLKIRNQDGVETSVVIDFDKDEYFTTYA